MSINAILAWDWRVERLSLRKAQEALDGKLAGLRLRGARLLAAELAAAGLKVRRRNGTLLVGPREKVTPALEGRITFYRSELHSIAEGET